MLCSFTGIENIACIQNPAFNLTLFFILHFNTPIHHRKNLLPIVDVPLIGPICPVKFHAGIAEARDVLSVPGLRTDKFCAAVKIHFISGNRHTFSSSAS
nr:MAG TPA_asm: hypothetical protein [Caudoviricetes sp.]